jgi:hypothetical protein
MLGYQSRADRDTHLTSPSPDLECYLAAEDIIEVFDGTKWIPKAEEPKVKKTAKPKKDSK